MIYDKKDIEPLMAGNLSYYPCKGWLEDKEVFKNPTNNVKK